jgi:hypothetical protein
MAPPLLMLALTAALTILLLAPHGAGASRLLHQQDAANATSSVVDAAPTLAPWAPADGPVEAGANAPVGVPGGPVHSLATSPLSFAACTDSNCACTAANCKTCVNGSATVCSMCNAGYTLSDGQCSLSEFGGGGGGGA